MTEFTFQDFPFRPGLERFEPINNGYYYPGRPDLFIRLIDVDAGAELEEARFAREMLHSLSNDYHIPVVPFHVVASRSGELTIVTHKIEGEKLGPEKAYRGEIAVRRDYTPAHQAIMGQLFEKQLACITDKIDQKQPLPLDIYGPTQYVVPDGQEYGVLVDVEPAATVTIDSREFPWRLDGERYVITKFGSTVAEFYLEDPQELEGWQQKCLSALEQAFASSNVAADRSQLERLIQLAMAPEHIEHWFDGNPEAELIMKNFAHGAGYAVDSLETYSAVRPQEPGRYFL